MRVISEIKVKYYITCWQHKLMANDNNCLHDLHIFVQVGLLYHVCYLVTRDFLYTTQEIEEVMKKTVTVKYFIIPIKK